MTEHPKYNNEYTAKDIERYYTGKMSSLEMHQLEKAAMEDPFLADALEGYSYTNTPVQDSEYMHQQLHAKTIRAKVLPLASFNKKAFLRIAALFILLAGCGWAIYKFGFNKPNDNIAIVKQPDIQALSTDTNKNDAVLQQSTSNAETNTQTTTVQEDKGSVSIVTQNRHTGKLNSRATHPNEKNQNDRVPREKINEADEGVPGDFSASLKKESSVNEGKLKEEGNIASVKRSATAPAQVSASDSIMIGSQTQKKKDNLGVIVMRPDTTIKMNEIVVGNRKEGNYRKPRLSFEKAEPEKGVAAYDEYVAENLQLPEGEIQKNISGEIRLAFDVNETGQATNITVEKSLCAACDKEAIRILQQGPKWVKKKKNEKGKLSIKF
jgi:hypothetical protein